MLEYFLSLLRDPEDAPLFSEVYGRYRDTVRAGVLQALNQQCDIRDIVDSIWAEEARQFHETKENLLEPGHDAYRGWIGAFSTFIAIQKDAKIFAETEAEADDLELAWDEEAEESE